MLKERENNYDLLRISSAIGVIAIHVSSTYISAITNREIFGYFYKRNMITSYMYNVLPRFAVPCFVMLGGGIHFGR